MLKSLINKTENYVDSTKLKLKKHFNLFESFRIYPYDSFANEKEVSLTGRVLEKEGILDDFQEAQSTFSKLKYMFRRYESDEIPFIKLKITVDGNSVETTTTKEGFYHVKMPFDGKGKSGWHEAKIKVIDNPYTKQKNIETTCRFIVASDTSDYMIISDVDDTIIKSYATNTYLKIKTLLFKNVSARVAFEGVPELYKKLQENPDGSMNPLFFVSGSSWNLYDLLDRFCEKHEIPEAPFFLRSLGIENNMFIQLKTRKFKIEKIKELFAFYPYLPAIFIGDSGQKDPEIYYKMAMENPDRVKAIFIRNITNKVSEKRQKMIEELKQRDIDMVFIDHTQKIKKHINNKKLVDAL